MAWNDASIKYSFKVNMWMEAYNVYYSCKDVLLKDSLYTIMHVFSLFTFYIPERIVP